MDQSSIKNFKERDYIEALDYIGEFLIKKLPYLRLILVQRVVTPLIKAKSKNMIKISYGLTVCDEYEEINNLIKYLLDRN